MSSFAGLQKEVEILKITTVPVKNAISLGDMFHDAKIPGALHSFLHPTGCNRPLYHNQPD